ncbi:gas vesicle protein GvpO [Microlunatus sp. Gsoil 973]|uniref:gas vesicle protein GvpO n=1 Tax=Microlunatus sp. Gsoil 973 TaxID=2672569 RepID=UPI0012B48F11|nr:gas vesicle protein [Microlunatus sp. Gsoil 973]
MRAVRAQFTDLSGEDIERITGVHKDDDSTWTVGVEVVEIRMVPDTADILAQYDVQVDGEGDIVGYRRGRRYLRGRADG